jgi:hypothetical protein
MHVRRITGLTIAVLTCTSAAAAAQAVVLDSHWVHTADLADSHYRQAPIAGAPTNWVAPVNYASGSAWVHLEVLTKPTDEPTKFQVCFEGTPSYGCTNQSTAYTTTGTLEWETPFTSFYIPPNESVDWTKGAKNIAVILKDTMNGKPSAGNVGATQAARFTPTEVRVVVTLVSPGGTYVKPPPYNPTTPDAGAADAAADSGSGSGGALGTGGLGGATSTGGATGVGGATTGSGGANGSGGKGAAGATSAGGKAGAGGQGAGGTGTTSSAGSPASSADAGVTTSSSDDSGCTVVRAQAGGSRFPCTLLAISSLVFVCRIRRRRVG